MVSLNSTITKPTSGKEISEVNDILPDVDLDKHGHVVFVSCVHKRISKYEYGEGGTSSNE